MSMFRRLSLFAVLVFVVMLSGCATVPKRVVETRQPLSALCQQAGIEFSFDPVTLSARLSKDGRKAAVVPGSSVVTIGSESILLDSLVVLERNELYVPDDFQEKVLCRLDIALCAQRLRRTDFRVVIDPGHGGKDPGAISRCGLQEKEVVLDISRRLERLLTASGYHVRLTRSTDVFISLEDRTQRVAEWGADIFISIHANASTTDRVAGFEVWTARGLTGEDLGEKQREKNQGVFFSKMNMQRRNLFLEKTLEDMMYRHKHKQSLRLANSVSRNYVRSVSNRGLKESGFFVLRNTLIPAILVEVGFLSNAREAQRLRSSSHRQEIAEAIADGVKEYIRSL